MAKKQKDSKTVGCIKTAGIAAGRYGADYLQKNENPKAKKAGRMAGKLVNAADTKHRGGDTNALMVNEAVGAAGGMFRRFGCCSSDGNKKRKPAYVDGATAASYTQVYGNANGLQPPAGSNPYGRRKTQTHMSGSVISSLDEDERFADDYRYEKRQDSEFYARGRGGSREEEHCGMTKKEGYMVAGLTLAAGVVAFVLSDKVAEKKRPGYKQDAVSRSARLSEFYARFNRPPPPGGFHRQAPPGQFNNYQAPPGSYA